MKKFYYFLLVILLFPAILAYPQSNFSVDLYKQFLSLNKDMTKDQLLIMYPAGVFKEDINCNYSTALYFDSINIKYKLTEFEKELISKNGFMVSERLSFSSFGKAFFDVFQKDLPVFISTDAILHAFHRSYDRILMDVETAFLLPKLKNLLTQMHNALSEMDGKYSSHPEMKQTLKDVDLYVTLPLKLLDNSTSPFYSENAQSLSELIDLINNEQPGSYKLFSDNCRVIDFSQFKPRGHYARENSNLQNYFKTMIWLGKIEIYLSAPESDSTVCPRQSFKDIKRQIIDAFLISELIQLSNSQDTYSKIEDILKFFTGNPDNVTLPNLEYLKQALNLTSTVQLLDNLKVVEFQDTLKNQSFASQLILSQILYSDPTSPDKIIPASAFLLFGQRFIVDSYVTGRVVFDKITYNNEKICRLFPSTLDPIFALGNNAAAQLLSEELNTYKYSSNLASLRYLIDNYDNDYWDKSIYNLWLNTIRKLNPPAERNKLPGFMQTAAFWQEKLNTQLASWAQLRHDNILYAKQSYTGGTSCSYPYVYIEPIPEFFNNLNRMANIVSNKFATLDFNPAVLKTDIINYFNDFENITDTLFNIANKEISGEALTLQEESFLKKLIYQNESGSGKPPYLGWYARLFYLDESGYDGLLKEDYVVADIHTTPTDCGGGDLGGVVHVGTGPLNMGVFVVNLPENKKVSFIGPVLSYQEITTTNFKRLTDEEWTVEYLKKSFRPSWTNLYLADISGNSRGDGLKLITSLGIDVSMSQKPQKLFLAQNYPNPFNSSTIIRFTIPYHLTNSQVKLNIYNLQGELIKQLINKQLPAGDYISRWDGTNNSNTTAASGIYFYNLNVGGNTSTGKMILMK